MPGQQLTADLPTPPFEPQGDRTRPPQHARQAVCLPFFPRPRPLGSQGARSVNSRLLPSPNLTHACPPFPEVARSSRLDRTVWACMALEPISIP